jgi:ATP-dependent helicase/nuclease subunit B
LYLYLPRGLFDAEVARLLDRQLGREPSPVAKMRLRQDGGFYVNSDVCATRDLGARLELARRTILHAAEGIAAGAIEIAPLLENQTLACRTCEFVTLCRFEREFNRPRVAERSLPALREFVGDDSEGEP